MITTPCQSPLPAVMSLGYLIGQLATPLPTPDLDAHFEFLYSLPAGTIVKFGNGTSASPTCYELLEQRRKGEYIKMRYDRGRLRRRHSGATIELTRAACARYQPEVESEQYSRAVGLDALAPYPAVSLMESVSERIPKHQNWHRTYIPLQSLGRLEVTPVLDGSSTPQS